VVQCVTVRRSGSALAGRSLPCCESPLLSTGRGVVNRGPCLVPASSPLLALAVALSVASSAGAQGLRADTPKLGALYANGQNGRYLVAGQWLFRLDPRGQGLSQAWQRHASTAGWSLTTVPNAWNATGPVGGLDARRRRLVPQGLPSPE